MNIGLIDVDGHRFPNLAMMKISSYHKSVGDQVEWYNSLTHYDRVYMSKVFSFSPEYSYFVNADEVVRGGTGYDIHLSLPVEMERVVPDYNLYGVDKRMAYGFLTRGCPNKCKWCVVPEKEGKIHPYMDIEEIAVDGRTNIVLMDNNVLASDYGLQQIEKIVDRRLRVDFNQAIDARLVTDEIAQLLAKVRWMGYIRLGCDTPKQIAHCERAMQMIDKYRDNPAYYLMYAMLDGDMEECYQRLSYFKNNKHVRMVAQPFRDVHNPRQVIPQWQSDMSRWAMRREFWTSMDFKDFRPRKGFVCGDYFATNTLANP